MKFTEWLRITLALLASALAVTIAVSWLAYWFWSYGPMPTYVPDCRGGYQLYERISQVRIKTGEFACFDEATSQESQDLRYDEAQREIDAFLHPTPEPIASP